MSEWPLVALADVVDCLDTIRRPVRAADRQNGPYPYYGASGIIDHVDKYLLDGTYALVAEDGENLRSRNTPISFIARGRFWVNNHAHVLAGTEDTDVRFLAYRLEQSDVAGYLTGSTQPKLTQRALLSMTFHWPPIEGQRAIASVLGTLDNKLAVNSRVTKLCGVLAAAYFAATPTYEVRLSDVATAIMGQSPPGSTYNEDGIGLPFYQGRRDFGYRFPSERVWCSAPTRIAERRDVLLSVRAPVGALNVSTDRCAIGRGVAAIRSEKFPSTVFHSMNADDSLWVPFQHEGTLFGSIGKTQLNELRIKWPNGEVTNVETVLAALDSEVESLSYETARLVSLRDALIPKLLNGQIQVSDTHLLGDVAV